MKILNNLPKKIAIQEQIGVLSKLLSSVKTNIVDAINSHLETKATASISGHVKISSSTSVTDSDGYALDASQANPSVAGSLRALIDALNSSLMPQRGDAQFIFTFSTKPTEAGFVITNSVFVPVGLTFNVLECLICGAVGNFANQVTINRNGNYVYLSASNTAFAGLTASCTGKFN